MKHYGQLISLGAVLVGMMLPLKGQGDAMSSSRLPPLPEGEHYLSEQPRVFVERFEFKGNTVFSDEDLAEIAEPYMNRELTTEDLHELRNILTRHYINNGYINSGVVLPDQEVAERVITFKVIEGVLSEKTLSGNKRLKSHYVFSRIESGINEPLNIFELQKPLQLLQQNRPVATINAQLAPGDALGESVLNIKVKEALPYEFHTSLSNHRSPSIGSYQLELGGAFVNLTGWGEVVGGSYQRRFKEGLGLAPGQDDYSIYANIPITRWDTELQLGFDKSSSTVVTDVFRPLDIKSESDVYRIGVRQPVYRTLSQDLSLALIVERKKSNTYLLGQPFSFSDGVDDGESRITRLNFVQEWLSRSQQSVFSIRSEIGFGVDALDATVADATTGNAGADSKYVSWLGQVQYLRQLPLWDSQLLARANVRFVDAPVLPLEKFAIGGYSSVRGYRENALTSDEGVTASLEWRIPVVKLKVPLLSKELEDGELQLAPFLDYGWGRNEGGVAAAPSSISSAGMGLRWSINRMAQAEIYWGHALRNLDFEEQDIQDNGLHFEFRMTLF